MTNQLHIFIPYFVFKMMMTKLFNFDISGKQFLAKNFQNKKFKPKIMSLSVGSGKDECGVSGSGSDSQSGASMSLVLNYFFYAEA